MGTERDERIEQLEQRLRRRTPLGVTAALAVVLGLAAIWLFQRRDLQYFFSAAEPVSLGREGEYRWEGLESNRYAEIHGVPTTRGLYAPGKGGLTVVVGLQDTPLLVRRRALPGEDWVPEKGGTPPQPDQRPFAVAGRLLAVEDGPAWAREAAVELQKTEQVRPREGRMWVLLAGERPGLDRGSLLVTALLLTFVALNGYFLARDARHRLRLRRGR